MFLVLHPANAMLFMYEGFVLVFTTDVFLVVIVLWLSLTYFGMEELRVFLFLSLSPMTGRHSCSIL